MRVHENIKRLARNYPTLFIVFFACALYQMLLALVGLLASLALWELFKYCSDRWKFDRHPSAGKLVIGIGQCGKERYYTSRCRSSEATSLAATFKELLTRHKSTVGEFPTKNEDWLHSTAERGCANHGDSNSDISAE